MELKKVVIVSGVRTPIDALGGGLAPVLAQPLATHAIKAALAQAHVDPANVDYTVLGWVMQDSRCPNIAKTAAEQAGVPPTSPGTTLHEN